MEGAHSITKAYSDVTLLSPTYLKQRLKKRVVPQIEIEDSESDDYPAFTDRRSRTVVRSPSHRAREEYSTSAPRRYSASPRYSNVPIANLVAPLESPRREMPSSNADGSTRILDPMETSLQQGTLERRALSAVRDIEEAPHSRPVPRNSVLREDEDNFEGGSYLSHPRNSSNSMSYRLTPRYLPPQRREPSRYVVGRQPSERSRHEETVRFQTPANNDISDEAGTMARHAGQGRTIASQRREPALTLRFRAPPNHPNQSSISETAAPRIISRRPQYDPYWPLGNTPHHAHGPSNRAFRASTDQTSDHTEQLRSTDSTQAMTTSNPARGKGKRRSPHNGASNHDVLQHAREPEASQQDIEWDKASSDQMQFQR
jgi:hypothetical protein